MRSDKISLEIYLLSTFQLKYSSRLHVKLSVGVTSVLLVLSQLTQFFSFGKKIIGFVGVGVASRTLLLHPHIWASNMKYAVPCSILNTCVFC